MAAKYLQIVAEVLEDEYDIQEAISHYEKSAELYKQECSYSAANKCYEKIAEYAAIAGDYDKVQVQPFFCGTINILFPFCFSNRS